MPGSRMLAKVSANGTPVNATVVTSVLSVLVCVYAAAFFLYNSAPAGS